MPASPSILRVCQVGSTITFQVIGRVTMEQSMPLRRLAELALADGVSRLHIDLRRCVYIDSTFVGTLLVLHKAARDRAEFAICCPSTECQRVLETMGLSARFAAATTEELPEHAWQNLDVSPEDRACLKYNVADSHEELVNVGGATAAPFRGIVETMHRELAEERKQHRGR